MTDPSPHACGPTHSDPEQGTGSSPDAAAWDERYSTAQIWSGAPNSALVAALGQLPVAGSAIDLGCGEGADAIWLAARGWQVTAIDWSVKAIQRARQHAMDAGADIEFLVADLATAELNDKLGSRQFQLAVAAFLHTDASQLSNLYRRLPRLVSPGGYLLVIAHSRAHGAAGHSGPPLSRLLDPPEVLAALELGGDWHVTQAAQVPRENAIDTVVLAQRENLTT